MSYANRMPSNNMRNQMQYQQHQQPNEIPKQIEDLS
jgi:hypothetical protein